MITTALEAIASARHADPFSVLGPHVEHGLLTIRTCLPAAEAVSVLDDGEAPLAMTRTHPVGIYEATLPEPASHGGSFDYRLRVTYPGGYNADVDDPYRFGRVIRLQRREVEDYITACKVVPGTLGHLHRVPPSTAPDDVPASGADDDEPPVPPAADE